MRKIYVASSWRNVYQQSVVAKLRLAGHEVYDFRNPAVWEPGFHWSSVDPQWEQWTPRQYRESLRTPAAERGFAFDWNAMKWADTGVLVMPCGRSAHLEAGYFSGAKKKLYILLNGPCEPELMYRMADAICLDTEELLECLR